MSRLRVRIELNRGGVGVPLDKLASVVQQAQSFFRMLGDDVHIDQTQGDWLGFDFDHESLNFTAEFVGAVTQDQVAAFHSAFDGSTPLRRATIAQFARIADAIEEDEVIGFGLYLNEGDDPAEWRCLSRRDALRITEEIQVLLGAAQVGQESHLPVVADVGANARYMFGKRDRGVESAKLAGAVREVEASLSKRIGRLEGEVADHSGYIQDLRSKSFEAEQSMGRLLSAVEGFCEQAANRLETVTAAPALSAAATAGASPAQALSKPEIAFKPETPGAAPAGATSPSRPSPIAPSPAASPNPVASMLTAAAASPNRTTPPVMTAAPFAEAPPIWWQSPTVILVGVGTVVILLAVLFWPSSSPSGTSASEPAHSTPVTAPEVSSQPAAIPPAGTAAVPKAVPVQKAAPVQKASVPGALRVELEASEPSWVSIRGRDGNTQMTGLIQPGKAQSVDIREPAVLRAGNAGGLSIRANGKLLGPLGPHGAIRDVEFKNGEFKLVPVE
jgi:hypothetical protein